MYATFVVLSYSNHWVIEQETFYGCSKLIFVDINVNVERMNKSYDHCWLHWRMVSRCQRQCRQCPPRRWCRGWSCPPSVPRLRYRRAPPGWSLSSPPWSSPRHPPPQASCPCCETRQRDLSRLHSSEKVLLPSYYEMRKFKIKINGIFCPYIAFAMQPQMRDRPGILPQTPAILSKLKGIVMSVMWTGSWPECKEGEGMNV